MTVIISVQISKKELDDEEKHAGLVTDGIVGVYDIIQLAVEEALRVHFPSAEVTHVDFEG